MSTINKLFISLNLNNNIMKNKKQKENFTDAEIIQDAIESSDEVYNVVAIKQSAIMSIEISGAYYQRIYNVMTSLIDREENPEEFITAIVDCKEGDLLTLNQAIVQLLMSFIKTVEEKAQTNLEEYTEKITIDKDGKQIVN
jgi:hypothetical protein